MPDENTEVTGTETGSSANTSEETGKTSEQNKSADGSRPPTAGQNSKSDESKSNQESDKDKKDSGAENDRPLYTQAELNRIIQERLAREKRDEEKRVKAATEEAARDALVKRGEYVTLYNEEKTKREQLENEIEQFKLSSIRDRAGAKYKLPPEVSKRLVGANEEEIMADAVELSKLLAPPKAPNQEGGARGGNGTQPSAEDQRKLTEQTMRLNQRYRGAL